MTIQSLKKGSNKDGRTEQKLKAAKEQDKPKFKEG